MSSLLLSLSLGYVVSLHKLRDRSFYCRASSIGRSSIHKMILGTRCGRCRGRVSLGDLRMKDIEERVLVLS